MTTLYVLKNLASRVLYVGVSSRPLVRWGEHRADKDWWPEVASVEVSHFAGRQEAEAAERTLIRALRPPYNVDHNPAVTSRRQYETIHLGPTVGSTKLACCGLDYWLVPEGRVTALEELASCGPRPG